jgi:AcrR family transcriptional regulator
MNQDKSQFDSSVGLRERKKSQLTTQLKQCALQLFTMQGYGATTLEQIATTTGVSARTVFRYFATKEHLLFDDDHDVRLAASFRSQPPELSVVTALRNALHTTFGQLTSPQLEYERLRHAIIAATPELKTRNDHELVRNIDLITSLIAEREGAPANDPQARILTGALVGVLIASRVESEGADPLDQMATGLKQFERLMITAQEKAQS